MNGQEKSIKMINLTVLELLLLLSAMKSLEPVKMDAGMAFVRAYKFWKLILLYIEKTKFTDGSVTITEIHNNKRSGLSTYYGR